MNKKILSAIIISTSIISNSYGAVTSSVVASSAASSAGIAAANNARRAHEEQMRLYEKRIENLADKKDGMIEGVFLCQSAAQKKIAYYGLKSDKCKFWSPDEGYTYLTLKMTAEKYLKDKEIVSIFFNAHDGVFEFYYRGKE